VRTLGMVAAKLANLCPLVQNCLEDVSRRDSSPGWSGGLLHTGALMATWEITITRGDGSRLRFTEQRGDPPQKGDVFEVDVGQINKARIETYREERPGGSRASFFQVAATET
jgi:hypothetical protein